MHVLVVEDEPALNAALVDLLEGDGHTVTSALDGDAALLAGRNRSVDLVLLDLMLPGTDGLEVCRRLRDERPDLFILILTARGDEDDKVVGLGVGADDYVTKPFGARELLARVEAFSRRNRAPAESEVVMIPDGSIDLGRCEVSRSGSVTELTPREVSIIRLLHTNRKRAVPRSELLEKVWNAPGNLNTRTVDMTIANLRQKVEPDPKAPSLIVTVKGVGYAWGEP